MTASRTTALTRRVLLALLTAAALPTAAWSQAAAPRVKLTTSAGDIVLQLEPAKAPKTVANFLQYVQDKHYDGTVFHRVIDGFMIQGGGFTPDLRQKPTRAPVPLEADNGLKNDRGTIAMARTSDPNSATAQFFINVKNNDMLNAPNPDGHGYTVFGKVVSGMDVVDKIRAVPTGAQGPMRDVPVEPVVIRSATVLK
ncbi:peptidylprolyl isomerase [Pseudacidovorax intermedius]|uniref:Peptidyl-prolyl cis-trans isomerase n=1 Tax=Pseudacidovorax intermedius TaxID=433924 RepID=A0A147H9S2_9BURK|nr:peptidylprolyl isomerase [Pseudacidovorax intermedius]